MRILYIVHNTDPYAGSAKSLMSMVKSVRELGNEVAVLCPDNNGVAQIFEDQGIKVFQSLFFHIKLSNIKNFKNFFRPLYHKIRNSKIADNLLPSIQNFNPDIIHENTSVTDIGFLLAKRLNKKYIVHIREFGDKDFNWKLPGLKKRLADKITYSVSITQAIKDYKGLNDDPKAFQLYNGIIKIADIRYSPEKKPFFLYAGRIETPKGVFELIKGYCHYLMRCKDNSIEPYKLILAGKYSESDEYYNRCLNLIKECMATEFVEFVGPRNDLNDLMYKCTALIIPSISEGLGRVLPEGLCNGALCIGRNTEGTKEQMELGKKFTGQEIALSFLTEDELSDILLNVTKDSQSSACFEPGGKYFSMIEAGQKFIAEFLTIDDYGEKIIQIYNQILESKG